MIHNRKSRQTHIRLKAPHGKLSPSRKLLAGLHQKRNDIQRTLSKISRVEHLPSFAIASLLRRLRQIMPEHILANLTPDVRILDQPQVVSWLRETLSDVEVKIEAIEGDCSMDQCMKLVTAEKLAQENQQQDRSYESLKEYWRAKRQSGIFKAEAGRQAVRWNSPSRQTSQPRPQRRREYRAAPSIRRSISSVRISASKATSTSASRDSSDSGGPSSGPGDDPGPRPRLVHPRANTPILTLSSTLDATLGAEAHPATHIVGTCGGDPHHTRVAHLAATSTVVKSINNIKEVSMFNKVTNLVAAAVIAVVLTFIPAPVLGHFQGGSHEAVPVSINPHPIPEATPMKVPVSLFTSFDPDPLTKSFTLEDGQLVAKPGGHMVDGQVERVEVDFQSGFAELLTQVAINQACGYGVPGVDKAHITTRENAGPGDLARIRENFKFLAAAMVMMLDYDVRSGTVPLTREELVDLLVSVCPEISGCALVISDSASTHIVNAETGEVLKGEGGKRVYIPVENGTDIPRAGQVLFNHLVLAGHGHIQITKAGTMLVRTIIDGSVWQPERLDFAAGACCGEGLIQLRPAPTSRDGATLDTLSALPPLTQEEERRLAQVIGELKAASQDEADAVRAAWIEDRINDHVRRVGYPLSPEEAQRMRVQLHEAASANVLPDGFVLHHKGGTVTVGELLADLEKWNGTKFADPLEPDYHGGELLAMFIMKPGRPPYVWSFAHGGQLYSFMSTPPTPPAVSTTTSSAPAATEQELVDRFKAIPVDTPSDLLPAALLPIVSELRSTNPITASKVIKLGAKHLGVGATVLGKQIKEIEKELDDEDDEDEEGEDECLVIARGVNEITNGELVCIDPPAKPSIMPIFHRVQPEGHLLPVRPEELQDIFNQVAGRPLEPGEFTLVAWYLASSVLEFRGGAILQQGILCKNGYITFELGEWFIPGRPKQPAVFFVPRTFIEDPAALPPLESLATIQGWKRWGVNIVALIELIARVLLTRQTGICYVFWGPGGEGKSTFMKYVVILVGDANVLHAQIADFSGERRLRGIATLRGKLLAVFDDAPHNMFDVLGPFLKEGTTAETLAGAAVYQDTTSFPNTSLIVILSNHPSIGKDRTRGGADRRKVHVWSHRIRYTAESQMDAEIAWTQDETELDVIFSYGVHFARRYLETGKWQFDQPVEEAVYIAESLTTVEARFLWERFEQAEDHYICWDDIDAAYNKWWPDHDHRDPFSHDRFFTAVEVTWGGELCRRQEDNYRTRGVTGIKLLPKQKPTFTPKPGPSDVDLGFGQVVGGQKMPRIEGGPSSGEEKKYGEGDEGNIFQESGRGTGAGVGFSGHLDLRTQLGSVMAAVSDDVTLLSQARAEILRRVHQEGSLHIRRVADLLPTKLQPQVQSLVDDLVTQGVVECDGTWITPVGGAVL